MSNNGSSFLNTITTIGGATVAGIIANNLPSEKTIQKLRKVTPAPYQLVQEMETAIDEIKISKHADNKKIPVTLLEKAMNYKIALSNFAKIEKESGEALNANKLTDKLSEETKKAAKKMKETSKALSYKETIKLIKLEIITTEGLKKVKNLTLKRLGSVAKIKAKVLAIPVAIGASVGFFVGKGFKKLSDNIVSK